MVLEREEKANKEKDGPVSSFDLLIHHGKRV
jgi:hypothetical protein